MSLNENALQSIARQQLNHPSGRSAMFEFGAVTTVDINSQKVFEGIAFSVAKRLTFPVSPNKMNIVFDATAVTKDRVVLLPMVFKAYGAGPIYIDLYYGGNYGDDGTEITCFNRDNTSSNTCESVVRVDPTITTPGTKLGPEFVIHSNGVAAVTTIGGEVVDELVTLISKAGKYRIEIANQDSSTADAWFGLNFFEANEVI